MIRAGASPSVDQCFVHIEYERDLLLVSFFLDLLRNDEGVFLSDPTIEIVFELSKANCTVVRNRNWTRKLFSHLISSFSGMSLRLAFTTTSLMNILYCSDNNINSSHIPRSIN